MYVCNADIQPAIGSRPPCLSGSRSLVVTMLQRSTRPPGGAKHCWQLDLFFIHLFDFLNFKAREPLNLSFEAQKWRIVAKVAYQSMRKSAIVWTGIPNYHIHYQAILRKCCKYPSPLLGVFHNTDLQGGTTPPPPRIWPLIELAPRDKNERVGHRETKRLVPLLRS